VIVIYAYPNTVIKILMICVSEFQKRSHW